MLNLHLGLVMNLEMAYSLTLFSSVPCIFTWSARNSQGILYFFFKSAINNFHIKLKGERSNPSNLMSLYKDLIRMIHNFLSSRDHSLLKHRNSSSMDQVYCFFSLWLMAKVEVLAWPTALFPYLNDYLEHDRNPFSLKQMSKIFFPKKRILWTPYKLSPIKATKVI